VSNQLSRHKIGGLVRLCLAFPLIGSLSLFISSASRGGSLVILSVFVPPEMFAACILQPVPGIGSMTMLFLSNMSIAVLLTVAPVPPMMVLMMVPASSAFVSPTFLLANFSQLSLDVLFPLSGQILLHRIILVMILNRHAQLFVRRDCRPAMPCACNVSAQSSLPSCPRLSLVRITVASRIIAVFSVIPDLLSVLPFISSVIYLQDSAHYIRPAQVVNCQVGTALILIFQKGEPFALSSILVPYEIDMNRLAKL